MLTLADKQGLADVLYSEGVGQWQIPDKGSQLWGLLLADSGGEGYRDHLPPDSGETWAPVLQGTQPPLLFLLARIRKRVNCHQLPNFLPVWWPSATFSKVLRERKEGEETQGWEVWLGGFLQNQCC